MNLVFAVPHSCQLKLTPADEEPTSLTLNNLFLLRMLHCGETYSHHKQDQVKIHSVHKTLGSSLEVQDLRTRLNQIMMSYVEAYGNVTT